MKAQSRVSGGSPETKGGRRPTVVSGEEARDIGRWSSRRKMEVVLRLLRGEDLDGLSRKSQVSAARLTQWRDRFLSGGQAGLMSREPDARDEQITRLKAKVGDLTMANELLDEKIEKLEANLPPAPWRSKR